jgi:hypothetical protein
MMQHENSRSNHHHKPTPASGRLLARVIGARYVPFADATRLWQDTGNSEV